MVGGHGILRFAKLVERNPKVVMGLGKIGFEIDGFLAVSGCFFVPSKDLQRSAEIVMRFSQIRLNC